MKPLYLFPQSPQSTSSGPEWREVLAAMAMQALLANESLSILSNGQLEFEDWLGRVSYAAADCLIKESLNAR